MLLAGVKDGSGGRCVWSRFFREHIPSSSSELLGVRILWAASSLNSSLKSERIEVNRKGLAGTDTEENRKKKRRKKK